MIKPGTCPVQNTSGERSYCLLGLFSSHMYGHVIEFLDTDFQFTFTFVLKSLQGSEIGGFWCSIFLDRVCICNFHLWQRTHQPLLFTSQLVHTTDLIVFA